MTEPLELGGVIVTVALVLPDAAVGATIVAGTPAVTEFEAGDAVLVPLALVAVAVNV
jgi:hypothetical protein